MNRQIWLNIKKRQAVCESHWMLGLFFFFPSKPSAFFYISNSFFLIFALLMQGVCNFWDLNEDKVENSTIWPAHVALAHLQLAVTAFHLKERGSFSISILHFQRRLKDQMLVETQTQPERIPDKMLVLTFLSSGLQWNKILELLNLFFFFAPMSFYQICSKRKQRLEKISKIT